MPRPALDIDDLAKRVLAGERAAIGRSITLLESTRDDHLKASETLLAQLMPHTGKAHRIGISGVPGVGKSTFIESFGLKLLEAGFQVAVLAVDPSSGRHGGSILGDKTRMERLSMAPGSFIRPSPSSGVLGGVARATRETISILEAAGYDMILVETVGTGQSETMVADLVDMFMVLMLPGAGDDLQGIKKGILEIADMVVVNKIDSAPDKARHAARDYKAALHMLIDDDPAWHPPVLMASGLTADGLDEILDTIKNHQRIMKETGGFDSRRARQSDLAFEQLLERMLLDDFARTSGVKQAEVQTRKALHAGTNTMREAIRGLIKVYKNAND